MDLDLEIKDTIFNCLDYHSIATFRSSFFCFKYFVTSWWYFQTSNHYPEGCCSLLNISFLQFFQTIWEGENEKCNSQCES